MLDELTKRFCQTGVLIMKSWDPSFVMDVFGGVALCPVRGSRRKEFDCKRSQEVVTQTKNSHFHSIQRKWNMSTIHDRLASISSVHHRHIGGTITFHRLIR
jgi:hypothetical protein